MWMRKQLSLALACALALSCLWVSAGAAEVSAPEPELVVARATGRFSQDIPANTIVQTSVKLPLERGETVTIRAVYSPEDADVDFGLVDSDGLFHYVNVTDGSVDTSIEVDQRGTYTFAICNNSSFSLSVSGYINY